MKLKIRMIAASIIFIAVTIFYNFMSSPFNKRIVAAALMFIIYLSFREEVNHYVKHFFGEVKKDILKQ